ncbi:hypothetical protein Q8A67_019444 [Cirrhinus molitorella]|uniref:Uncharacterized protein n=1 Tax=Cirrhinus molitorella TaxID=172907 RepID=A0AA88TPR4_9TELE|nr:hypothetical protein Q8A67_019444 [Cirrhinus molitorella]
MIQSDREKLSSKQQGPRELPRRSSHERKPHRRYKTESRPPPHSPRRTGQGPKRYEERVDRDNPNFHNSGGKRFRDLPRNRVHRSDNDKEKSGYVSPEKWNKLTLEIRARIMAEREKGRPNEDVRMNISYLHPGSTEVCFSSESMSLECFTLVSGEEIGTAEMLA